MVDVFWMWDNQLDKVDPFSFHHPLRVTMVAIG